MTRDRLGPRTCRTCKRLLAERQRPDGTVDWVHGIPPLDDHDPDPVDPDELSPTYVCDFCSQENPTWVYPARSFDMVDFLSPPTTDYGSVDDWAACDPCHALIEADDRDGLIERSLQLYKQRIDNFEVIRPLVKHNLKQLHDGFHRSRSGAPYRDGASS